MNTPALIIAFLFGAAVPILLWRRQWWIGLVFTLVAAGIGIGGLLLIEQLSPAAYAKLPMDGPTFGRIATWSITTAVGASLTLLIRGVLVLVRPRKK